MSNKFREINRESELLLPANMEGWLGGDSLARFVVDVVESLDIQEIENAYKGGGSQAYPPKMMLALIFYCYATGIFSSRAIERATYEMIPVIYITAGTHPDHDSINTFRKRFLPELSTLFVQILEIAHGTGVLKLGEISIDGTKIKANASKHKAMSWKYACQLEKVLKAEIEELLKKAESAEKHKNIDIPAELERRESRLEKIAEAKKEIEARAQIRYEQEKAEYEAKIAARQAKEKKTRKKIGGKKPQAPEPGPQAKDQVNFTDEESRIMPVSGGGFEQAYNSQASVDMDSLIIVGNHVSQQSNDKQEIEPTLVELDSLPETLGQVDKVAADSGYFSKANAEKLAKQEIEAYIPSGRQSHNQTLEERFQAEQEAPEAPTPVEAMKHRIKTDEGKKFYARRKSTVEPVFGIIKEVMGFRRFSLRGLEAVTGEWNLVCLAFNLKRLYALKA